MADITTCPPLTPSSIRAAHSRIKDRIHLTPLLTNRTIDRIASSADPTAAASVSASASASGISREDAHANGHTDTNTNGTPSTTPRFRLHFKCENMQKIGAFKARGAFHAVIRLMEEVGEEEVRRRGVVTHSSGNHAQALALAATTFSIPAHIVMPSISTPSKIAGTQSYTPRVYFSGSTSVEREAKVAEVQRATGAILVPPYDHPDIMLGQGTSALEMHDQFAEASASAGRGEGAELDAMIAPLGGGGLLSGCTIFFSDKSTRVFGAEPNYQGANDGERGLNASPPCRVETVKTLTIADGLRTPVGLNPWKIFTSGSTEKDKFLQGVYSVSEEEIKKAWRLVLERMKVVIEPSSAVPLAVILYNTQFREWVAKEQEKEGKEVWDVGVIFSGGNTTMDAIAAAFAKRAEEEETQGEKRAEGKVGLDGKSVAENVAG